MSDNFFYHVLCENGCYSRFYSINLAQHVNNHPFFPQVSVRTHKKHDVVCETCGLGEFVWCMKVDLDNPKDMDAQDFRNFLESDGRTDFSMDEWTDIYKIPALGVGEHKYLPEDFVWEKPDAMFLAVWEYGCMQFCKESALWYWLASEEAALVLSSGNVIVGIGLDEASRWKHLKRLNYILVQTEPKVTELYGVILGYGSENGFKVKVENGEELDNVSCGYCVSVYNPQPGDTVLLNLRFREQGKKLVEYWDIYQIAK